MSSVMVTLASMEEGDLRRRRSTVGSIETNETSHTTRLEVAVTTLCDFVRSCLVTATTMTRTKFFGRY